MGRIAIDTLLSILEDAFEGDTDQSLLANLRDVRDDDWLAAPPDGRRSIADILEHVGWAKWMDEDYAFGPATLRGDVPPMVTADLRPRPKDELLAWLREGHHCLTASVAALADDRELVEQLREQGKRVDYLMLPDEGHDVLKFDNRVRVYNAITDFFKEHLRP